MQVIFPAPRLRPCWEMGELSPTMYWSFPAASFTMLPTARISNDGYGSPPAPGVLSSWSARPVWPCGMLLPFSDVEFTGVEAGARPVLAELLKICAQVNDAAGICRIVLHGTVRVMPFTVTVPPQRTGSSWGHMLESSVAAWMKPRMS